jgi:hypothetical protein
MGQKTFAERLASIDTNANGQLQMAQQIRQPKEDLSKREKILASLRILESKGISTKSAYPPLYWGLHKIGIYPRPLHYKPAFNLFILGVFLTTFIFGGILALGIGENISRGPVAGLYRAGWPGVFIVSLISGVVFAVIIRGKAMSSGIPRWSDIWQ